MAQGISHKCSFDISPCRLVMTLLFIYLVFLYEAAPKQFRSSIVQEDQLEKALQALVEQSNEETPTNEIDNV